jgi:uncharacterized protein YjcR
LRKKDTLRIRALKMADKGMTAQAIADKLGVRKMTVAAWKAHRTMGTYSESATVQHK